MTASFSIEKDGRAVARAEDQVYDTDSPTPSVGPVPLEKYGPDDLQREYHRVKGCAPLCTVGCVHRVAQVDELRENPQGTLAQWFASPVSGQPPRFPLPVKILMWVFVTNPGRDLFRRAAAGVSGDRRV